VTVAAGESLLAPSLTRRLIEEHLRRPPPYERVPRALQDLTQRELEVFTMIAKTLIVSEATRHTSTGSWRSST
jgi:DNA-binding NarL/FixJ family response regulator